MSRRKLRERAEEASDQSLESAYVDANERVLDPSLLDKPLLDRLPHQLVGGFLVMPYQGKAKTSSGLYIPDEVRERENVATVVAYVMKLGPLASKTKINLVVSHGAKKVNGYALVDTQDRFK